MMRVLLFILFSCTVYIGYSQSGKAVLSQNIVEVGETFTLTYAFPMKKEKDKISFTPDKSVIEVQTPEGKKATQSIEIHTSFHDTIMDLEDGPYWIGVYELICWDSGEFIIPSVPFWVNGKAFELPKVSLTCKLLDHQASIELYDIKENFIELPEEDGEFTSFVKNYCWILLLIIAGFILFWVIKRKKSSSYPIDVVTLTLEEQTLLEIEKLMQQQLWKKDKLKEHYVALSMLLKDFLSHLFALELKERTSSETILLLKQLELNGELVDQIDFILQQSDLVKFANSAVVEEGVVNTANTCKQIVQTLAKLQTTND